MLGIKMKLMAVSIFVVLMVFQQCLAVEHDCPKNNIHLAADLSTLTITIYETDMSEIDEIEIELGKPYKEGSYSTSNDKTTLILLPFHSTSTTVSNTNGRLDSVSYRYNNQYNIVRFDDHYTPTGIPGHNYDDTDSTDSSSTDSSNDAIPLENQHNDQGTESEDEKNLQEAIKQSLEDHKHDIKDVGLTTQRDDVQTETQNLPTEVPNSSIINSEIVVPNEPQNNGNPRFDIIGSSRPFLAVAIAIAVFASLIGLSTVV